MGEQKKHEYTLTEILSDINSRLDMLEKLSIENRNQIGQLAYTVMAITNTLDEIIDSVDSIYSYAEKTKGTNKITTFTDKLTKTKKEISDFKKELKKYNIDTITTEIGET